MLDSIYNAWNLKEFQSLSIERASLINTRIGSILQDQQSAVSRSVEYLLSALGCLAVVDLTISFISTAKSLEDDEVMGIFDFFKFIPQDGAGWGAILLVTFLFLYLHKIRT
ncbi:hypothetical protein ACFSJQ_22665 [Vibrio olivae]|uniref:Uncharacterized protein n=1 Tax=Vibrio olivae TaxID=1243002 RepID=A0ABV5HQ36_9VIBR